MEISSIYNTLDHKRRRPIAGLHEAVRQKYGMLPPHRPPSQNADTRLGAEAGCAPRSRGRQDRAEILPDGTPADDRAALDRSDDPTASTLAEMGGSATRAKSGRCFCKQRCQRLSTGKFWRTKYLTPVSTYMSPRHIMARNYQVSVCGYCNVLIPIIQAS